MCLCLYEMDFSVRALHDLEEKIQTLSDNVSEQVNCRKIEDVTIDLLKNRTNERDVDGNCFADGNCNQ